MKSYLAALFALTVLASTSVARTDLEDQHSARPDGAFQVAAGQAGGRTARPGTITDKLMEFSFGRVAPVSLTPAEAGCSQRFEGHEPF